jgi:hypothetical protein
MYDLAKDELTFLQDVGGKVEKPATGPVTTKDVADCMAIIVHTMIGQQVAAMMGRQLSSVGLRATAQGGIHPDPHAGSKSDDPRDLLSRAERGVLDASGGRVSPARGGKYNADGTTRRGSGRRTRPGLPRFRN